MFTPDAITRQQRLIASHRQNVFRLDSVQVPLFGLPAGWGGVRATGNTNFESGVTRDRDGVHGELHETVTLMHVDGASRLEVESTDHRLSVGDDALLELLGESRGELGSTTITLDDHAVEFASARHDDLLVARWVGYEVTVSVRAQRWPMSFGLALVRITDLAPYHEGRLRMLEQRSGYDLRG